MPAMTLSHTRTQKSVRHISKHRFPYLPAKIHIISSVPLCGESAVIPINDTYSAGVHAARIRDAFTVTLRASARDLRSKTNHDNDDICQSNESVSRPLLTNISPNAQTAPSLFRPIDWYRFQILSLQSSSLKDRPIKFARLSSPGLIISTTHRLMLCEVLVRELHAYIPAC
jgi:hypothetical protein